MSQEHTCETCGAALDAEATLCLHCGAPGPAGAAGGDEVYRETGFRAQALPVAAGDVLSGRFRLVRALGRGGMGVVWLASDEELDGQHVALKVLRPEIAADSGGVADMKREVIITRELRHPYIVGVYDHHTEGERVFITMAYVDGPSLADALTARERKPYALEEVLPWAQQVAEALDYAHGRGVLHRDVKPGNILLAQDGTAHLTDFGIARMARDTLSRRTGHTASGTLAYMSPQQLLDEKAHRNDPRNDVYSFAATLYELLSGDPPFTSGGIEAQIALKQPDPIENVPDHVNNALLQGLAKEVGERPETCAALVRLLRAERARREAYPLYTRWLTQFGETTAQIGPPGKDESPRRSSCDTRSLDLGSGIRIELVWIAPGHFLMGSEDGDSDEQPVHPVEITRGFWMGKYAITQEQWKVIMGCNPSHFRGMKRPVDSVSWKDCEDFSARVSTKVYPTKCRLPTEAEWEYACRAGTQTGYYHGDEASDLHEYAWYRGNANGTLPVGLKRPNAWGLQDMLGNVWEWCSDGYGANYYSESPLRDPHNTRRTNRKVVRGGSWSCHSTLCRVTFRGCALSGDAVASGGLRVVLAE